jgi:carbon starvation protein CstA
MGMMQNVETQAVEVLMIIISIIVIAVLALILPTLISAAGYTGSAATIVALIPMFIPIGVILAVVGKMFGFLTWGGI